MSDRVTSTLATAISKAPIWLRNELVSTEAGVRLRAEEALAAMLTAALQADKLMALPASEPEQH